MTIQKILVIDDSKTELHFMNDLLGKRGYAVRTAENGDEAMKRLGEERPDLILMDIQLPDLDGLEVTRRIRASEADGKIPIVAVTSFAMAGDRQKALAAGCNGYIEKPINPESFLSEIHKYCEEA